MNPEYVLWEQKKGKNFRTEGHKSHNVQGLPSAQDNK